jgi:hypothetical protein
VASSYGKSLHEAQERRGSTGDRETSIGQGGEEDAKGLQTGELAIGDAISTISVALQEIDQNPDLKPSRKNFRRMVLTITLTAKLTTAEGVTIFLGS